MNDFRWSCVKAEEKGTVGLDGNSGRPAIDHLSASNQPDPRSLLAIIGVPGLYGPWDTCHTCTWIGHIHNTKGRKGRVPDLYLLRQVTHERDV